MGWRIKPFSLERRNHINNVNYTVTVQFSEAADSESITFNTADTSIPLTLHYDRDYNISVVASNCVGNSTPAKIHIRLGRPHACLRGPEYYITAVITLCFCTLCMFISTVYCGSSVGRVVSSSARRNHMDKLRTYCLHSQPGLGFAPEESKPDKSTLFDDCSKNESVHQHSKGYTIIKCWNIMQIL